MSAARPTLVKSEHVTMSDRAFWLMVRQGLLLLVKAVERRYLPGLKKCEIDRNAQNSV